MHLEYKSKKKLVGGSFDILIGSEVNGEKPFVNLYRGNRSTKMSIYLGSLLESKSSDTRFTSARYDAAGIRFDETLKCLKFLNQAMAEVMALAEVTTFRDEDIPILNILGNKYVYLPLLYFKKKDVILTTPRVIHLRINSTTVDTLDLQLLFTLFQLHKKNLIFFAFSEHTFPKSGWKEALKKGDDNYKKSQYNDEVDDVLRMMKTRKLCLQRNLGLCSLWKSERTKEHFTTEHTLILFVGWLSIAK